MRKAPAEGPFLIKRINKRNKGSFAPLKVEMHLYAAHPRNEARIHVSHGLLYSRAGLSRARPFRVRLFRVVS